MISFNNAKYSKKVNDTFEWELERSQGREDHFSCIEIVIEGQSPLNNSVFIWIEYINTSLSVVVVAFVAIVDPNAAFVLSKKKGNLDKKKKEWFFLDTLSCFCRAKNVQKTPAYFGNPSHFCSISTRFRVKTFKSFHCLPLRLYIIWSQITYILTFF